MCMCIRGVNRSNTVQSTLAMGIHGEFAPGDLSLLGSLTITGLRTHNERRWMRSYDWRRIATRYDRCAHIFLSASSQQSSLPSLASSGYEA